MSPEVLAALRLRIIFESFNDKLNLLHVPVSIVYQNLGIHKAVRKQIFGNYFLLLFQLFYE